MFIIHRSERNVKLHTAYAWCALVQAVATAIQEAGPRIHIAELARIR